MNDPGHSWAAEWDLSRRYNFNHGSLGFTPKAVLARKEALDRKLNAGREEFIREGGFKDIENARKVLAAFLGADEQDLVLTVNITEAINSVLKSLPLGPGDDVLITSHMYSSYPAMIGELARRQGFGIVVADIPYAPASDDELVAVVMGAVTANTRLAIIEHIPSPTALIFPVQKIVAALQERGVDTFIDGAHAPGQVPVNLNQIGAAYYGGNNHKWLCAPLSSGFLHVRRDKQADIIPAIGSVLSVASQPFTERFSWQGVIDYSPRLVIPDVLQTMAGFHPDGWDGIYRRNHELAVAARVKLGARLGIKQPVPDDMIGAMFTLPLGNPVFSDAEKAKSELHRGYDYMVETCGYGVIFSRFQNQYLVRVTCHLYNCLNDYDVLADGLDRFMKDHSG